MNMNIVFTAALGVGGATVIGTLFGFLFNKTSALFENVILSFAAGVMLATSVLNLIIPAVGNGEINLTFIAIFGIFCGALCISLMDIAVNKLILCAEKNRSSLFDKKEQLHRVLLFVTAVAIHNLPEGIAAGVGFGTGNTADALTIAGSIALQNFPEGMIIIAPMLSVGIKRSKVLFIGILTGVIEIIGTFFGYCAVSLSSEILPFALSFAGGTMIYVICGDMIPETQSDYYKQSSTYSLIIGFCLMLVIDCILK